MSGGTNLIIVMSIFIFSGGSMQANSANKRPIPEAYYNDSVLFFHLHNSCAQQQLQHAIYPVNITICATIT